MHAVCRKFDVTIPALLFTAWGLLLASRTSNPSACVLYASSGRDVDVDGIQDMVGPVLTGLVCWMPLRPDETFMSLVSRVQEDHYDHLQHQHSDLAGIRPSLDELADTACSVQPLTSLLPGPESGILFEHVHAIEFPSEDFLFSESYSSDRLSLPLKYHWQRSTEEYARGLGEDLGKILNAIVERPLEEYVETKERENGLFTFSLD